MLGSVRLLPLVEWLELGVFVGLGVAALARWGRRREQPAAWLAVTFILLGAVLVGDRFLPGPAKEPGHWFDRAIIIALALFPYCLYRFTSAFFRGRSRRPGALPERVTALLAVGALMLPDVPGGPPSQWPWWYALYTVVFLVGWTGLSFLSVVRLWRCGRGQPGVTRRRMRLLAVAAVVLNLTIFVLAAAGQHPWTGLTSGVLFAVGFAPPRALRARWRRREMEAFHRAEDDLMRADTAERVTTLMLPHAARLVGAETAVLVGADGQVRAWHGTTADGAAEIAAHLPGGSGDATMVTSALVAVRLGSGWLVVPTTAATPFFGHDELDLLRTLAHLAGLALDRAELFDRERTGRQTLAERESQLAEAQRTARLGSYTWDLRTDEVTWSDELHRLFGFRPGEITDFGPAFAVRLHPDDRDRILATWGAARHSRVVTTVEYRVVLPNGETRWMHGRVRPALGPDGNPIRVAGTIQDITERKLAEDAFAHQATHDALTGLPNRALFLDRLGQALARRQRHPSGLAVLFLDVDRFKWLNDSLGHAAGDHLLMAVADRLRIAMRAGDSVARFGGDEFVVLCDDVADEAEAETLAARLAATLAAPITIGGDETTVTVSIGIAYAAPGGPAVNVTPESLVRDADAAMYRAKDQGRNRHEVFDATTRALALARHETVNALRRGIDQGDLLVHYQPALDLTSGRIVGVEALVRWDHPTRGVLAPGEFITLAEETGLVVPLGTAVLGTACRQLAEWQAQGGPLADLSVSVNIAARQLLARDLPAVVEEALSDSGLDPSRVCLEITESALLEDSDSSTRALNRLKAIGVRIGVDDFGTGFSSLTYLKRFPVDVLKIDRSFVEGLGRDRQDRAIVASIVDLAHAFGLTTVAEGIETPEQLDELRALGCEWGQGFLWSPALPADAAGRWIAAGQPSSPAAGDPSARTGDTPLPPSDTPRPHRVLLVEDDVSLRYLLRLVLDDEDGFEVVAETNDGREAIALARHLCPDLVVLDLALPGIGGLEALPVIRAVAPDAKIVVLSGLEPAAYAEAAQRQGADAFHAKGGDPTELPGLLGALLAPTA